MNFAAYIVVGAILLLGGKWETPAIFQRKPPTAQLQAAQQQLATAQAAQHEAEAKLAAAEAARQAKLADQLDYTQQMVAGADLALHQVREPSPEVKLAAEFSSRAVAGFEAARGRLSAAQQAEIKQLFDSALAARGAEVATLQKALAEKDADLQKATREKAALEKQIPVLEATVTTAKAETQVVAAKTETLTAKVVTYANETAAERAKNGSLDAYAGTLVRILIGLGLLYAIVHWWLPSLAQSYPGRPWLVGLANATKNVTTAHL